MWSLPTSRLEATLETMEREWSILDGAMTEVSRDIEVEAIPKDSFNEQDWEQCQNWTHNEKPPLKHL